MQPITNTTRSTHVPPNSDQLEPAQGRQSNVSGREGSPTRRADTSLSIQANARARIIQNIAGITENFDAPSTSTYLEQVDEWQRAAVGTQDAAERLHVVQKMRQVYAGNLTELELCGRPLTSLPPLPRTLKALYLSQNSLTSLPPLPPTLEKLVVIRNRLETLPPLPETLKTLSASHNQLTNLPVLPGGLEILDVSFNKLAGLPVGLPPTLKNLDVSYNRLTALPAMPLTLARVLVGNNLLPWRLSLGNCVHEVRRLQRENPRCVAGYSLNSTSSAVSSSRTEQSDSVSGSPTSSAALPYSDAEIAAAFAIQSEVDSRQNTNFSGHAPAARALERRPCFGHDHPMPRSTDRRPCFGRGESPQMLSALARQQPVGHGEIQQALSALARQQPVGHSESPQVSSALARQQPVGHGESPQVLSAPAWLQSTRQSVRPNIISAPPQLLRVEDGANTQLAIVRSPPSRPVRRDSPVESWRFPDENAVDFNTFVARVTGTNEFTSPLSQPRLTARMDALVAAMREAPAFRDVCFGIATQAIESCVDRITQGVTDMERAKINHDVEIQNYPMRELLTIGEGIFKLKILDEIAKDEIEARRRAGRGVDEVEIRLAFQVGLRDRLNLPAVAESMRFTGCAHVSDAALNTVEQRVKERLENSELVNFLVQWVPWQHALEREDTDGSFARTRMSHQIDRDALAIQPARTTEGEWMAELSDLQQSQAREIIRATTRLTRELLSPL